MTSPRNVKLTLEYDGTAYAGWQRQAPPTPTIQQQVEDALAELVGAPVCLHGAGRTDAGVHARAQVANFRTESTLPLRAFVHGLNKSLPRDVAIVAAEEVGDDFDARRSARGKHYAYRLWNRGVRSPLHDRTSWHIRHPLDTDRMASAGGHLLGTHDFSAFRAADCERKNPVRTLHRLDVGRPEPDLVVVDVEATAFLKNMVRVIVGTLVEVGLGDRPPGDLATILASRDRASAGRTAPGHGLTLERVSYE